VAGTTRDYLTRPLALGGVAAELIDTAGWAAAADTVEEQAQRLGAEQAARADVVVWCDEFGAFAPADEGRLRATGADVLKVRTKGDLASGGREPPSATTFGCAALGGLTPPARLLDPPAGRPRRPSCRARGGGRGAGAVAARAEPEPVPAPHRRVLERLREARALAVRGEHPELLALALRGALDPLGEMTGAVYTTDLLDRIFSRFCIGK
jgi:tRNA modification GTPase